MSFANLGVCLFIHKPGERQIDPHSSPFVPENSVSMQFEHRDVTGCQRAVRIGSVTCPMDYLKCFPYPLGTVLYPTPDHSWT
jgi:hypothetical protein